MDSLPPLSATPRRTRPETVLALVLGVVLAITSLVAVGALLYSTIAAREEAGAWVRHTLEVARETEEVAKLLSDAETGERGFLLTDRYEYLSPYYSAVDGLPTHLTRLRTLTSDNPRQQARLDQLEPLVRTRISQLQEIVRLHASGDAAGALARVRTDEGRRTMDTIRLVLAEVEQEEDALLEVRRRALAEEQTHLLQRLGGGLLCIALAIAAVIFLLLRSTRVTAAREAQFRSMFEAASEGIWILDADGRVTMANAAMSALLGYPLEELIGKVYWEHFLFPEDVGFARDLFQRRRGGTSQATDLRFRHRTGKPVWTLLSAQTTQGPGGTYAGALDFFTDITERHLAEERGQFLSALGTRLLALTPPEDLARATTEGLRQFLDVDRCTLEELDGERLVTIGVSVRSGDPGPPERPLTALGHARADVLAGRRVVVEDATRAPRDELSQRARAWVLLPRRRPGDGTSVLTVESATARAWAPGDLDLLASVADRASLAIENARLQRDLSRRFMELDAIYAQASVGLAFVRRDRRFVRVNAALARIHGRTPEACEQRLVEEVVPALWPQIAPALARVLDRGEDAVEVEAHDDAPNGRRHVFRVGNYAVRDAQGRVEGAGVVVQDVTERRNAEEALRANNALLRLVADTVPDLLFARDRQHRTTLANPALLALAGRAEAEVLGHTVREWWRDPRQAEQILATDERIMTTGQPERIEEEYVVDGEVRVFQAAKTPLRDRDGGVVGLVGVSRDITRERHYARSLERMVSERTASLSRSLASLEQLLYSIAHDLRAPNRAVHSFAELLEIEAGDHLDPRSRLYLDRIKSAALRNDHLILDLLEYGRLAHADVPLEDIDLEPVVREALLDLEVLVGERDAEIEVGSAFPRVCANRTLLKQVLVNLLGNAVKYVPPDRRPTVRLHAVPDDGHAIISVVDNGIGISADDVGRVFEPFARLPNAAGVPGTGMGLAIVQKAAERMQGEVGVESSPGEGSRFWVRLPAAPCTG